jgi:GT2 family glycosyltransferase
MSSPIAPLVDVVIVNYRTGPLVVACLGSLEAERRAGQNLRVTIVDNASADGSADLVAAIADREWGGATLVRSSSNGGFGRATTWASSMWCAGRNCPPSSGC